MTIPKYYYRRFILFAFVAICSIAFSSVIFAQDTNAAAGPTPGTAAPPMSLMSLILTLIPFVVPLIVAAFKWVLPRVPSWVLPILAPILGALIDYISSLATGHSANPLTAALLGSAGVGVREVLDQVKGRVQNGPATAAATILLCLGLAGLAVGCAGHKLQNGGAYAPGKDVVTTDASGASVTNFVPTAAPDYAFFVADSAFDLAYSTIDAAFSFERDNRAFLWQISPSIKHALDNIRPTANQVRIGYSQARQKYLSNPTPAGLTSLQTYLSQIQNLAASAQTAIAPAAKGAVPVPK